MVRVMGLNGIARSTDSGELSVRGLALVSFTAQLALAYRALFDKDHQRRCLDFALEAADGALAEFRKAKADFYIDKA
jgi:hypothetical protein